MVTHARFAICFLACLTTLTSLSASADERPLAPESTKPWDAGAGFDFKKGPGKNLKLRRAASGVACNANDAGKRMCLLVFDEDSAANYFSLTANGYSIENEPINLRMSDGELDAEGAATDGKHIYVVGSHSVKRNTCKNNPDSRYVIRLIVDKTTGRIRAEREETTNLWPIMMSLPELKNYVGDEKCLGNEKPKNAPDKKGQRGVNIEGIAVRDGRLHFGLRGPAMDSKTFILSIDADALFKTGATAQSVNAVVTGIEIGADRGIRDLLARKDGVLILAGPDDDDKNVGWTISLWNDRANPPSQKIETIGRLTLDKVEKRQSCDDELKPEAMALIDDNNQDRIIILSDGMCDGGPLVFNLK